MKRGAGGKTTEVGPQTANAQVMPVLDEGTFQQILEAAYVLQEQNAAQQTLRSRPDAGATLAEIAETQQLLRSQVYDLHSAAGLIAERLQKITHATSIIIALIREHQLEYCAATGKAQGLAGSSAPMDPTLAQFLQQGDVVRRFQLNTRLSAELLQKQDSTSPVIVPVFHDAKIAGILQLSFPEHAPIQESELRSCQVMAGLMGEVIGRAAEAEWKQALATERATMLDALEQLRPQLERLAMEMPKAIKEAAAEAAPASSTPESANPPAPELIPSQIAGVSKGSATCGQCGYHFGEGELFCGRCGTPRAMNVAASGDLPANWDALWQSLQQPEAEKPAPNTLTPSSQLVAEHPADAILPEDLEAAILELAKEMSPHAISPTLPFAEPSPIPEKTSTESQEIEMPKPEFPVTPREDVPQTAVAKRDSVLAQPSQLGMVDANPLDEHFRPQALEAYSSTPEPAEPEILPPLAETHAADASAVEPESHPEPATEEKPESQIVKGEEKVKPSPWGSAARAREWLNSLEQANSPARVWLSKHRADLWVGLSIILLILALSGWGTRSVPSPSQAKTPPQPSLSLFERMLVSLGLAEAPPAPVYLGNPNAQVWVDLHTALYYCPNSDLFGKTAGGKFTTQRDAQMDQFEPAANKPCD